MAENPFLLPPGSNPAPKQEPTIEPPVAPPSRDPDRYIAIPPSIESATHRITRPETVPTAVPPPAGPATAPSAPPAAAAPVLEHVAVFEQVSEETRLAVLPTPSSVPLGWSLVLPDGSRVPVDGPILLGRDPAPLPEHPDARSLALDDPGKTVSKTHALIELAVAEAGVRVTELHSTNGVAITSGGDRVVLTAGGDSLASLGSVIELGSFTVLVDAR